MAPTVSTDRWASRRRPKASGSFCDLAPGNTSTPFTRSSSTPVSPARHRPRRSGRRRAGVGAPPRPARTRRGPPRRTSSSPPAAMAPPAYDVPRDVIRSVAMERTKDDVPKAWSTDRRCRLPVRSRTLQDRPMEDPSSAAPAPPASPSARRRARRSLVERLAAAQDGIVSRRELYEQGITRGEIRANLRAGRWRKVGRQSIAVHWGPLPQSAVHRAAVHDPCAAQREQIGRRHVPPPAPRSGRRLDGASSQ